MCKPSDIYDKLLQLAEIKPDDSVPSDQLLREAEVSIGISFPESYRYFLKKTSNISFGCIYNVSLYEKHEYWTDLIKIIADARSIGLPSDLLPLAYDNSNYFCLSPDGSVVYWSLDGHSNERWSSIEEWIERVWIGENI